MKFWKEVSPYTGMEEDAPVNSVAGGGVAMPPDAVYHKKKKKEIQAREGTKIDARTKFYREHRKKLESMREKRNGNKSSKFIASIKERALDIQLEGPPGTGGDVLANVQARSANFGKKEAPLKKHRKKEMPEFPKTKMPEFPFTQQPGGRQKRWEK